MAGATSPRAVAVAACVVVLILLSSAVEPLQATAAAPKTKPFPCSKCDHACKKSCKGNGRDTSCSAPCGDPSNKAGCKSCLKAYYVKCLNYCGQGCRAVCIN